MSPRRSPAPTPEQRARRAAQRRTARAVREGRPALPRRLTQPYRAAVVKANRPSTEEIERKIGDKYVEFPQPGLFRNMHSYSAETVKRNVEKMSDSQVAKALSVSADEYMALSKRQGTFNVFWYHHAK